MRTMTTLPEQGPDLGSDRGLQEGILAEIRPGGIYRVKGAFGSRMARRAAGCLLDPREGDAVLLASLAPGRNFILAVLEQAREGQEMTLPGPLTLRAPGLRLEAADRLDLGARHLGVRAAKGELQVTRMKVLADAMDAQVRKVRATFHRVDEVIQRLTQRLGDSFRFVRGREETQAGSSRTLVEGTLELQAATTWLTAEKRLSLRAGHVEVV